MPTHSLRFVLVCMIAPIVVVDACSGSKAPSRDAPAASGAQAALSSAAIGLCSSVGSIVHGLVTANPPADASHATQVVGPDTVTFHYQWAQADTSGCRLSVSGSDSVAHGGVQGSIDAELQRAGWQAADSLYSADGPDGSMRGFIKGEVLCLREETWDGGDDADSTSTPGWDFTLTVTCAPRRADDHPPT
jgi:hypothetical protein